MSGSKVIAAGAAAAEHLPVPPHCNKRYTLQHEEKMNGTINWHEDKHARVRQQVSADKAGKATALNGVKGEGVGRRLAFS